MASPLMGQGPGPPQPSWLNARMRPGAVYAMRKIFCAPDRGAPALELWNILEPWCLPGYQSPLFSKGLLSPLWTRASADPAGHTGEQGTALPFAWLGRVGCHLHCRSHGSKEGRSAERVPCRGSHCSDCRSPRLGTLSFPLLGFSPSEPLYVHI